MFCIASFVILCLMSGFILIISIWKPKVGKIYLMWLKKAWGCVGRKFTLQKCEISFKDEVKNSILKKVVIKKPRLVKPISIGIEIIAAIVIVITTLLLIKAIITGALFLYGLF